MSEYLDPVAVGEMLHVSTRQACAVMKRAGGRETESGWRIQRGQLIAWVEQRNTELVAETWKLGTEIEERAIEQARLREALQAAERENERVLESALKAASVEQQSATLAARLRAEKASMRQDRDAAIARAEKAERERDEERDYAIERCAHWSDTYHREKADWIEERCANVEERDAALARAEKAEQSIDRLGVVADEAFGPFPVQSAEENLTAIEQGVFALRVRAEKAERERDEREPTQADGDAADDGSGEVFVTGWTGRRCIDCNCWVWGGPTRCVRCVERAERDAAIAQAEAAELRDEGWENTHNQVKAQWKEAVERAEKAERERDECVEQIAAWLEPQLLGLSGLAEELAADIRSGAWKGVKR